jgi:hypothetical protein
MLLVYSIKAFIQDFKENGGISWSDIC